MKTLTTLVLIIVLVAGFAPAQPIESSGSIRGQVLDAETNRPLENANVVLHGTARGASTAVDGSFTLPSVHPGHYVLSVSYLGYHVKKQSVTVAAGQETVLEIALTPTVLVGQTVVVTATRAKERETPVAFTNVDATEIARRYWAQDMPMLLSELPNVYAYSDNGNGIGYSYMRMRGFDQRRIAVMLNGVPLNDAESHEVFWVDLPDFAANTEDIQVQRGVGTSLYGASAFGGSVNVLTLSSARQPGIWIEAGRGSYNTRKYSIAGHSGLIDNTYLLHGRFSRIETDGYRSPSWSKLWSYFITAARFDETMTTRLNIFGGPEQSYLSYLGITRDVLNSRDARRINPFQYPNEVDNFYQPHYQLAHEWRLSQDVTLENTLFAFLGFGHYTQFRTRRDVREYNMSRFVVRDSTLLPAGYYRNIDRDAVRDSFQVRYVDLVRRRSVDDLDYGWLPRVTWKTDHGEFIAGGEIRFHRGHHWGEVTWANLLPPGVTPDWRYYDYVVPKQSFSFYVYRLERLTPDLTLRGDLQVAHHRIRLERERNYNVSLQRTYTFVTPRAGVNYNISSSLNAFFNVSLAQREPAFKDIHNPQDYWSNPINLPRNFRPTATGYEYVGKELKPERFLNLELGSGYRNEATSLKLNLYWMDFRNEIIPSGQIDDNGVPISGNAERSVHRGIELSGSQKLLPGVTLTGNVAMNDDRFVRHREFVVVNWDVSPPLTAETKLDGKRIGGFPDHLANLRLTYEQEDWSVSLHLQRIGRIYLDNTQQKDRSIDPVVLLHGTVGYTWKSLFGLQEVRLQLTVNNLADVLYAAGGYVDSGVPYFIPAAERNIFASLKLNL